MKLLKILLPVAISLLLFISACQDEPDQPFSVIIPAQESGLLGLWEGISLEKKFAVTVKDHLGVVINDSKNRPVWKDTIQFRTKENGYAEYIQFLSADNVNTFSSATTHTLVEGTDKLLHGNLPNMPVNRGNWVALRTINPSGKMAEVTSVNLYNPLDRHNVLASMIWTIKSVTNDRLVIEYTFGPQTYDTLFVKTFRKY
jgi:hypothetical protein